MKFLYDLLGISKTPLPDEVSLESAATTTTTPSPSPFMKEITKNFLRERTRLFELIGDTTLGSDVAHPHSLIKGCVQSGKSRIIHAVCLYTTLVLDHNVVVVVRNFTDDYDQFRRGFEKFLIEYQEFVDEGIDDIDLPNVYYTGDLKRNKDGELHHHEDLLEDLSSGTNVIMALANYDQVSKLTDCFDFLDENDPGHKPLQIIIDEVDQLGHAMGDRFGPQLDHLINNKGNGVIGISVTLFQSLQDQPAVVSQHAELGSAPFADRVAQQPVALVTGRRSVQTEKFGFKTGRVYYLTPPPGYKGITDIIYHFIEPTDGNLLTDPDLDRFLETHHTHEPYSIHTNDKHPMITLIKTERLIAQQDLLFEKITKKYKDDFTVITYNGTSCKMYSSSLKKEKLVLPVCKRKGIYKNGVHTFKNTPLPYVMQYLKNNGGAQKFPRVIIISYKLVNRGINIVSEDFGWHLTHMFYRPSSSVDVTNLIQSMRLCGIYHDTIPLQCYIPKKDYENLYKGHMLQEELFERILFIKAKAENDRTLLDFVQETVVNKNKVPKCALYRNKRYVGQTTEVEGEDTGWSMKKFDSKRCGVKMLAPGKTSIKTNGGPNVVDGVNILKLQKWKNENTPILVWKMVRFLCSQNKAIDLQTFKDGVEYDGSDKMFQSNVDNGKSKKARNGKLWKCKNNYNHIEINKNIVKYIS